MKATWLAGSLAIGGVACGGASVASAPATPEVVETQLEEILVADPFDSRTFVVLERLSHELAVGDELEGVTENAAPLVQPRRGELPTGGFTLYGPEGTCPGRPTRLVTLVAFEPSFGDEDGVRRAGRVRFAAVEVEADCPAWLALPGPPRDDVRFDPVSWREPTDEELDEDIGELSRLERGRIGDHADAVQRVGPIAEDDVCPEFVTYEIIPDDGAPSTTLSLPHEELLGLLHVGGRAVGVADFYNRQLVAPDGQSAPPVQLPIPSHTGFDIEASPCL